MLTQEQIKSIKKQLIDQIDSTFPEGKRANAKKQIEIMNSEELEKFLKQNKLIKTSAEFSENDIQQCIFCSIISGNIHSYKIDENNDALVVLEINPISSGHLIVIPKEHISSSEKMPKAIFSLAKKIAKKLKTKFKPKDVAIVSSNLFGHEMMNVFPVYENENINSQRQQAKPEELERLQKLLAKKKKEKIARKPKLEKVDGKLWLPKRIP